jgi:site-specific recombinase XerD
MLEAGVSIDDIKEMLGHDDETETCIYIHVTVDAAKQLLENHIGNPNR